MSCYHNRSPSPLPLGRQSAASLHSPSPLPPNHGVPPALHYTPTLRYQFRNLKPVRYASPSRQSQSSKPVQRLGRKRERERDPEGFKIDQRKRRRGLKHESESVELDKRSNPQHEAESEPSTESSTEHNTARGNEISQTSRSEVNLTPGVILRIPRFANLPSQPIQLHPPPRPASSGLTHLPNSTNQSHQPSLSFKPNPPTQPSRSATLSPLPSPRPLPDFVRLLVPPRPVAIIEIRRTPPPLPLPTSPEARWLNPLLPPQRSRRRGKSVEEFRAFVKRTNEAIQLEASRSGLDTRYMPNMAPISQLILGHHKGRHHHKSPPVPLNPNKFKSNYSACNLGGHFFIGRSDGPPYAFCTVPPFIAPRRNLRWIIKGEVIESEYVTEIGASNIKVKIPEKVMAVNQKDEWKCRFWA